MMSNGCRLSHLHKNLYFSHLCGLAFSYSCRKINKTLSIFLFERKNVRIYSMSHQIVEKNGSYCVLTWEKINCYLPIYFSVFLWTYFFLPSSCTQLNPWNHQRRGFWCLEGFCYLQILVCKTEKKNLGFSKIQVVLLPSRTIIENCLRSTQVEID